MPKVFDAFTFFNEEDLLELRIQELWPVVDKFIVILSGSTFRGEPHDYTWNSERFKKYDEKIYVAWSRDLAGNNPWEREEYQRNMIKFAVHFQAEPEDLVIISDVDEIPNREIIRHLREDFMPDDCVRLIIPKYSYAINMLTDEGNSAMRVCRRKLLDTMTPQEIRKSQPEFNYYDAGWEFSSLGTPEQIMTKFKSFAHSEFDDVISEEIFAERIAQGKDLLDRDIGMRPVEIDDYWPIGIKENRDYWRKYEWSA